MTVLAINPTTWNQITIAVEEICGKVFGTAKEVLSSVDHLGFENLLLEPNPNAEDKMLKVKIFDSLFTTLINFFEQQDKFDLVGKLINARQQILHLESLIFAVKAQNIEECNRLVELLSRQTQLY